MIRPERRSPATIVIASPNDVPPPPSPTSHGMMTGGFSIATFGSVRCSNGYFDRERSGVVEDTPDSPGYLAKLHPNSELHYELGAAISCRIDGQPLTFAPSLLRLSHANTGLLIVPIRFSGRGALEDTPLGHPVDTDELLDWINFLTEEKHASTLMREACNALGVVPDGESGSIRSLKESLGIQIWNLDANPGWNDRGYLGVSDSRAFAWELSALLEFTTDHVGKDKIWRSRDAEGVGVALREGYTYLGDHMVFVSRSTCLEITHLGAATRNRRASYRLETFGYDSSSLFIWAVMLYRSTIIDNLLETYRYENTELSTAPSDSGRDLGALSRKLIQDRRVADLALALCDSPVEARNVGLALRALDERGADRSVRALEIEMSRNSEILADVGRVREGRRRQDVSVLIGLFAAVIWILSTPVFVSALSSMIGGSHWLDLSISCVAMTSEIAVAVLVWRRRSE